MDVEKMDQPGQVQQGLHPVLNVEQLHLAARLPDNAVAARELAQAIAVYEIHARKIDHELLKALARKDVNQISQLSVTVAQRQPAHHIYDDDAILLSRSQLKSHSLVALFSAGIIFLVPLAFKPGAPFPAGCPISRAFFAREVGFLFVVNSISVADVPAVVAAISPPRVGPARMRHISLSCRRSRVLLGILIELCLALFRAKAVLLPAILGLMLRLILVYSHSANRIGHKSLS